jgi:mannose-6-phosphate isomerase-like protein (cupin superfamily)
MSPSTIAAVAKAALVLALGAGSATADTAATQAQAAAPVASAHAGEARVSPPAFVTNVVQQARSNTAFRKVLFTGTRSQLVVMSIPPGGEIGAETHAHVEQTLVVVSGHGRADVDGVAHPLTAGDAMVVTQGARHNVVNTGNEPLKLYTVYAPPNHIDGRVHATRADAERDAADEAFGNEVR